RDACRRPAVVQGRPVAGLEQVDADDALEALVLEIQRLRGVHAPILCSGGYEADPRGRRRTANQPAAASRRAAAPIAPIRPVEKNPAELDRETAEALFGSPAEISRSL